MKILSTIWGLIAKGFRAVKTCWDRCTEAENYLAQQRLRQIYEVEKMKFDERMSPYYLKLANALLRCVQSSCQEMGLAFPSCIEELLCTRKSQRVQSDSNGMVVFLYNAKRQNADGFMRNGKLCIKPNIPALHIKKVLNQTFPNYAEDVRFSYQRICVSDIEANRVVIEIHGAHTYEVLL